MLQTNASCRLAHGLTTLLSTAAAHLCACDLLEAPHLLFPVQQADRVVQQLVAVAVVAVRAACAQSSSVKLLQHTNAQQQGPSTARLAWLDVFCRTDQPELSTDRMRVPETPL